MKLKVDEEMAKKLFNDANVPKWFKSIIEKTYPVFTMKIIDRIKTFEDAFKEAPVEVQKQYLESVKGFNTPDEMAYKQLKLIILIINETYIPDYTNLNQEKWFPVFRVSSGFGFYDSAYYYSHTHPTIGSCLCFENKEKSDYVATQFINLYKDLITLNN